MAEREIIFILSRETDVELQNALRRLAEDFPGWEVCRIARREEVRNNQRIPVGVITVRL